MFNEHLKEDDMRIDPKIIQAATRLIDDCDTLEQLAQAVVAKLPKFATVIRTKDQLANFAESYPSHALSRKYIKKFHRYPTGDFEL